MKTRLTRRRWLTLAAAAGGVLAAGAALPTATSASGLIAGSGATTGPATVKSPAAQKKGSQIMNWFAQSSQGGFFEATRAGYYTELGLDMTMTQGGPGLATTPLVATGVHTFGMSSADSLLFAVDCERTTLAFIGQGKQYETTFVVGHVCAVPGIGRHAAGAGARRQKGIFAAGARSDIGADCALF